MQVQTVFYVERDGEDIELHIFGEAEPFVPGNRRGHPDHWTPDEGGYASVDGVYTDEDGSEPWDDELTASEKSDAESALYEAFEEDARCAAEDAAVERAEAQREDAMMQMDDDYGPYGPDIYDF
jgi:hypothetical protein